jgi:hypothetical protein
MKTINFEKRIRTCKSALTHVCMSGIAVELELMQLKHEPEKLKEIKKLETLSDEFTLLSELLSNELEKLQGVFKYNPN